MEGHLLLEVGLVGVKLSGSVDFSFIEPIYNLLNHPARFVNPTDVGKQEIEVVGEDVAVGDLNGLDWLFFGLGIADFL